MGPAEPSCGPVDARYRSRRMTKTWRGARSNDASRDASITPRHSTRLSTQQRCLALRVLADRRLQGAELVVGQHGFVSGKPRVGAWFISSGRKGGGLVDAPGRWLVGTKGESPIVMSICLPAEDGRGCSIYRFMARPVLQP